MVLAAKVFVLTEEMDLDTIAAKLKDYKATDTVELEDKKLELISEVSDLSLEADRLEGIFSQDIPMTILHRGETIITPRTITAPFTFTNYNSSVYLIILEKKQRANNIANQLSKILFITTGHVLESRITPDSLKKFHEDNFEDTKIIFFDNVDVPNVEKLSLYGSALGDTSLYNDYCKHGDIWYTVIKSKRYGYVVGVTRNCVVTVFSKVGDADFVSYIVNQIFPLIS